MLGTRAWLEDLRVCSPLGKCRVDFGWLACPTVLGETGWFSSAVTARAVWQMPPYAFGGCIIPGRRIASSMSWNFCLPFVVMVRSDVGGGCYPEGPYNHCWWRVLTGPTWLGDHGSLFCFLGDDDDALFLCVVG